MTSRREQFKDREYRAGYAESFLDTSIASQIRVLREQREWTQAQLAERAGMKQSRISALEDADYSKWSIGTLKRLARAFDVPLNVTFGTFGGLLIDISRFSRGALERPEFSIPLDFEQVVSGLLSVKPPEKAEKSRKAKAKKAVAKPKGQ